MEKGYSVAIENYRTVKELRTAILQLVKPDPEHKRFNLHDELMRILISPNEFEMNYKSYLDTLKQDLTNKLFKDIPEDTEIQFVDLFTQLIVFSAFMGWNKHYTTEGEKELNTFSLNNIMKSLPPDSLIRKLIKINEMPEILRIRIIRPIESCFQNADYDSIMNDLNHVYGQFYSDFLHAYNAQLAEDMGVVYTPDEIISFIVRSTDYFLKNREWLVDNKLSKIPRGILDKKLCFIDPAAGTMGFSVMMMKLARELLEEEVLKTIKAKEISSKELHERTNSMFNNWLIDKPTSTISSKEEDQITLQQDYILKNVLAFEVLIAPYVIGYFRMLLAAERNGAKIDYNTHKPLIFLKNALEPDSIKNRHSESDVMVIWGNPPYNISSQNSTPWIMELVDQYVTSGILQREPSKPAIKKLSGLKAMKDDVIKFHRFAQWQLADNNRQGIVAYVSNGFFIDGTVARGMRKSFRTVYDEIWVVNLFGNKEKGLPQRLRNQNIAFDQNVFESGCSRSIAITFMLRYPPSQHTIHKKEDPMRCKIYYSEKAGFRDDKLEWLNENDISSLEWIEIGERLDHELTPQYIDNQKRESYSRFPYFCGIFKKNLVGIVTGKDTLVMNIDKERLIENLTRFYNGEFTDKMTDFHFVNRNKHRELGKQYKDKELTFNDNRDWKISEAMRSNPKKAIEKIVKCQWRGFDERYITYYQPLLKRGTDQYDLMQYLLPGQGNVAICVARKSRKAEGDSSVFVTDKIIEAHTIEGGSGIGDYIFPLKINVTNTSNDDPDDPKPAVDSNINPNFKKMLPYNASDDEIFYYIYGILFTPQFRREFRELLKDDFPRIPFPDTKESLVNIAQEGMRLAKIHLFLENNDKKGLNPSSSLYNLLSKGMDDELSLSDCTFNANADSTADRRLRRIWFEGNVTNKKTGRFLYQQIDENGNWVPFRIFFDEPKKGREDDVFWLNGITRPIWEFEVGGRKQILEWLRVRRYSEIPKKNHITHELRHNKEELNYLRLIVSSIKKTLAIQSDLDKIYKSIRGQFVKFDINRLNKLVTDSH